MQKLKEKGVKYGLLTMCIVADVRTFLFWCSNSGVWYVYFINAVEPKTEKINIPKSAKERLLSRRFLCLAGGLLDRRTYKITSEIY